jgi:hypothetical protein
LLFLQILGLNGVPSNCGFSPASSWFSGGLFTCCMRRLLLYLYATGPAINRTRRPIAIPIPAPVPGDTVIVNEKLTGYLRLSLSRGQRLAIFTFGERGSLILNPPARSSRVLPALTYTNVIRIILPTNVSNSSLLAVYSS